MLLINVSGFACLFALSANLVYASWPCGSGLTVRIRLPPSLNPDVDTNPPAWESPPDEWIAGNWKVTYSSNKQYLAFTNFEYDSYPVLPTCGIGKNASPDKCPLGTYPGQRVDLTTFNLGNTSKIHSAFGYDTPRRINNASSGVGWNDVYDFTGIGGLKGVNNSWEMLAWGYDQNGDGYTVLYETQVTDGGAGPCLDIESRSETGPSKGTLKAIYKALRALNNTALDSYVESIGRIAVNGQRDGMLPFVCGPACQKNAALA